MKRVVPSLIFALLASVASLPAAPATSAPISERRVAELKQLRFGMFICWSFSTFSGKEWTPGVTNVSFFAATDCDTDQWASTAKEAGMGYILFLTKHHDGFCLWDTKTTDRKVTKAALGRDVLARTAEVLRQVRHQAGALFLRGRLDLAGQTDGRTLRVQRRLQPGDEEGAAQGTAHAIRPDRIHLVRPRRRRRRAEPRGDRRVLQGAPAGLLRRLQSRRPPGDIRLGEMGHPGPLTDESGAGFNAGHMKGYNGYRLAEFTYPILPPHQGGAMWFYSLPKHDKLCLPAEKIYADYLGAVKYGNIFSLDVGPDYAGKLREIDVQTLRKVGQYIRGELKLPPAARLAGQAGQGVERLAERSAVRRRRRLRWRSQHPLGRRREFAHRLARGGPRRNDARGPRSD